MYKGDSEQPSSCAVKSKYFTTKSAMDESLSDFQETKKSCAGPKITAKSKSSKPKRASKKIRGQKDIRTVLQSKKNELESYSKDFDKVCKKSGIDVDSEQLQLAIALSKSLQDTASTSNETSENSQIVNTQERIGKIRTTLQEYGFKVPEVKIAANTRKIKKIKKNYKLILTSETEKKEIIANRYSHVLFQNITHCSFYCLNIDASDIPLYYLASNATYKTLKISDTFCVNNLIEKSTNTGNLLRDWSLIPGRPASPKMFKPSNINFSEIECSQDELDIVLSGTLKNCKNIISKKSEDIPTSDISCKIVIEEDEKNNLNIKQNNTNNYKKTIKVDNSITDNLVEAFSTAKQYRSCSPDIFDDDASYICTTFKNNEEYSTIQGNENSSSIDKADTENNSQIKDVTEGVQNKNLKTHSSVCVKPYYSDMFLDVTNRKSNDLMELTECIQIQSKDECSTVELPGSQLSQNTNITKRKSNDYMEITECVSTLSQPISENIDLTQRLDKIKNRTLKDKSIRDNVNQNLDESHKTNPKPETSTNQITLIKHNEIDLTENPENYNDNIETHNQIFKEINPDLSIERMDLTQSSNTSEELPFVSLNAAKNNSLDDTIIVDINDYANINRKTTNLQNQVEIHIDLTQHSEVINEASIQSQSFFEEYNHDHSDNTEEPIEIHSEISDFQQCDPDKIDLTQSVQRKPNSHNKNKSDSFQISPKDNFKEYCPNSSSKVKPDFMDTTLCSGKMLVSIKQKCTNNIAEPIPVEYHYSNSGYKYCKPGKVDLTLSSIEQCDKNEINDIDLTQTSNTSEELSQPLSKDDSSKSAVNISKNNDLDTHFCIDENELVPTKNAQWCYSPGKKDDFSIDYDDFLNTEANNDICGSKTTSPISVVFENENNDENLEKHLKNNSLISNCSQNSEVFEISDKELDYSLNQSKLDVPGDNFAFGGISIMDEHSNFRTSKKSRDIDNSIANNLMEIESFPAVSMNKNMKDNRCKEISPIKHRRITEIATPQKPCSSHMVTVVTPNNSQLVIKTNNVTPMLDYESMSTPDIHKELDKYGIKPFKRKRAIQLLTHIYNQTHPIIEGYTDELASPSKRHRTNYDQHTISSRKVTSPRKLFRSFKKVPEGDTDVGNQDNNIPETSKSTVMGKNARNKVRTENDINISKTIETEKSKEYTNKKRKGKDSLENQKKSVLEIDDFGISRNKEVVSSQGIDEAPVIRHIECKPEDWVFQKREKAKVHSCRVPLHIAFHNYVSSRRDLREAILCYEPVEIDVIHKDLVGYGHRYDPKDLLKFLDKKCITVKTTDNDARNQKR